MSANENTTTEFTLNQGFAKLDELLGKLESPEISLEESFRVYKEGIELLKKCNDSIDQVEKQVLVLSGDGEVSEF